MMKISKILYLSLVVWGCMFTFVSCDEDETYGEKKEKERNTISGFIKSGVCVKEDTTGDTLLYVAPITVISEEQFAEQDSTTNVDRNEYVLLSKSGIYMQIIRKGCGKKLQNGETSTVFCRFTEFNIAGDSIQARNTNLRYVAVPDEMTCTNSFGYYSASYITGVMPTRYGTTSVPEGWLVPLAYINLGRPENENEDIAKVRVIVPHTSGNNEAQTMVYACFYEITYRKGR